MHVACVWNTYRAVRLSILDLIAWCGQQLEDPENLFEGSQEHRAARDAAQVEVEDICSSFAYHIHGDRLEAVTNATVLLPPRATGGLFLIWPLFVGCASRTVVSRSRKAWMRDKLQYIGRSMGLSQAASLAEAADDAEVYRKRFSIAAQGHLFLWSGSMFC